MDRLLVGRACYPPPQEMMWLALAVPGNFCTSQVGGGALEPGLLTAIVFLNEACPAAMHAWTLLWFPLPCVE